MVFDEIEVVGDVTLLVALLMCYHAIFNFLYITGNVNTHCRQTSKVPLCRMRLFRTMKLTSTHPERHIGQHSSSSLASSSSDAQFSGRQVNPSHVILPNSLHIHFSHSESFVIVCPAWSWVNGSYTYFQLDMSNYYYFDNDIAARVADCYLS